MNCTALIGKPTEHSVSHVMFEHLVSATGDRTPYRHLKINVEASKLAEVLNAFNVLGFRGLNVTLPYKLEVMKYLDFIDPVAQELGAVNTIHLGETTTGYNTDWLGIVAPIREHLSDQEIERVAIFGTGGAARAAIYAVRQLGAKKIIVLYRDGENKQIEDLSARAKDIGIELHDYTFARQAVDEASLIINATSAGMIGHDPLPFDINQLEGLDMRQKLFMDVVFNPLETPLLKYFAGQGAQTIDGLWMMIHQGVSALSIWLEKDIVITDEELSRLHVKLEEELVNA